MAAEIPGDGDPAHRHQIQTLILAVGILFIALLAVIRTRLISKSFYDVE